MAESKETVSDIDAIFGEIFGMIRIKVPYNKLERTGDDNDKDKGYFYLIKRQVSVDNIDNNIYPRLILRLYSLNPLADQIAYNQMEASCSGYPLRQYGDWETIGKEVKEIREYTGDTGDKNIFYGILIKRMLIYFFGCLPLEVESFLKDNSGENLVQKWDYLCYLTNLSTQRMMEKINEKYKNSINDVLKQWDPTWDSSTWKSLGYFSRPDKTDLWKSNSPSTGDNLDITIGDATTTVSQMGYRPCGFEIIKDKDDQKPRIKTRELMSDYQSFNETKEKIFARRTNSDSIVKDFCEATNGEDDNSIYGNYYLEDTEFKSTWPIIKE